MEGGAEASGERAAPPGPTIRGRIVGQEPSNDFHGTSAGILIYPLRGIIVTTDRDQSTPQAEAQMSSEWIWARSRGGASG